MSSYTEHIEKMSLPLVAAADLVAFPQFAINLEIDAAENREAVSAALGSDRLVFVINSALNGNKNYTVGTVCRVKQSNVDSDGHLQVTAEGVCRAELLSVTETESGSVADVLAKTVTLDDRGGVRGEAYIREASRVLTEVASFFPKMAEEVSRDLATINEPGLFADYLAANVMIRPADKQRVLDCFDPMTRIEVAVTLLRDEAKLLECELQIHKKVLSRINEGQRDRYLREQMTVLREELGDFDDEDEYYARIVAMSLPEEVEQKLLRENERMAKAPFGSAEAGVLRNYLDVCLELPWNSSTEDRTDVAYARRVLEEDHDGMEKIKERILEFLAVKKLNPELKNQLICLVGPPGTGKTSIARSIAKAMNREYVRVSLGGVHDEADIRGHRKTYIGAMPGRIIDAMVRAKVNNPLMLLDEIDKVGKDSRGDPASALLEVLDPEQNKFFRDHFVELPFDLSGCVFVCTANSLDTIPRPLIDRMEIIELTSYTRREKLMIAKHHLVKKQSRRHGLDGRRLRFTDEAIYEIIDYYTREAGVRNLERELAAVCRKAAMMIVEGKCGRVTVTPETVREMLGARKLVPEKLSPENEVGVVNGLAYTEVGGDLLKIEVALLEGSGKLELTGSLGDVMKESARAAVSYIRSIARELDIDPDFHKKYDLHLHFPEGAVPKDGPSAGIAMVTAIASALTGRPVYRDVAMTGEVTLRGRVLAIGGLREKTMAAYAMGIKRVLIPADNVGNLPDIDPEARENLEFIPVKNVTEVLDHSLCPVIHKTELRTPLHRVETPVVTEQISSKGDACRA